MHLNGGVSKRFFAINQIDHAIQERNGISSPVNDSLPQRSFPEIGEMQDANTPYLQAIEELPHNRFSPLRRNVLKHNEGVEKINRI